MKISKTLLQSVLLLGVFCFNFSAGAQQPKRWFQPQTTDLAVSYTTESGKRAYLDQRFWMQGGSAEADFTFYRGLGAAVSLSGEHASGLSGNVDFNKISIVAGPRYTRSVARLVRSKRVVDVFGQSLFGSAHGFNGLFPTGSSAQSSASSLAMQFGGGVDLAIQKGFSVRAFQLDYVRTSLPNNGANLQHDLRMGIGVVYRIQKH